MDIVLLFVSALLLVSLTVLFACVLRTLIGPRRVTGSWVGVIRAVLGEVTYINETLVTETAKQIVEEFKKLLRFFSRDEPRVRDEQKISPPPGQSLKRISELCFRKQTRDRIFDNLFDDWQREYNDALFKGDEQLARAIVWQYRIEFWVSIVERTWLGAIAVQMFKRASSK